LVDRADIFADKVDAVAGANGCAVVAEDVVRKTDARAEACGIAIVEGGVVG
jgi:hypothetical protein